jgi:hypothetical protein
MAKGTTEKPGDLFDEKKVVAYAEFKRRLVQRHPLPKSISTIVIQTKKHGRGLTKQAQRTLADQGKSLDYVFWPLTRAHLENPLLLSQNSPFLSALKELQNAVHLPTMNAPMYGFAQYAEKSWLKTIAWLLRARFQLAVIAQGLKRYIPRGTNVGFVGTLEEVGCLEWVVQTKSKECRRGPLSEFWTPSPNFLKEDKNASNDPDGFPIALDRRFWARVEKAAKETPFFTPSISDSHPTPGAATAAKDRHSEFATRSPPVRNGAAKVRCNPPTLTRKQARRVAHLQRCLDEFSHWEGYPQRLPAPPGFAGWRRLKRAVKLDTRDHLDIALLLDSWELVLCLWERKRRKNPKDPALRLAPVDSMEVFWPDPLA